MSDQIHYRYENDRIIIRQTENEAGEWFHASIDEFVTKYRHSPPYVLAKDELSPCDPYIKDKILEGVYGQYDLLTKDELLKHLYRVKTYRNRYDEGIITVYVNSNYEETILKRDSDLEEFIYRLLAKIIGESRPELKARILTKELTELVKQKMKTISMKQVSHDMRSFVWGRTDVDKLVEEYLEKVLSKHLIYFSKKRVEYFAREYTREYIGRC